MIFSKELHQLLPGQDLQEASHVQINHLSLDSRQIKTGGCFVAIKGQRQDGRDFISAVIEQGAAAILVEADIRWQNINWIGHIPVIAIEHLPQKISAIASAFYNDPTNNIFLIGITGTNGKTTCALLAAQLLAQVNGNKTGVIGTLGYGVLDAKNSTTVAQQIQQLVSTGLTTPDAINLQSILAGFRDLQVTSSAMEVSSHSLHQQRVAALHFTTAIFTNLTQDHLDYHGDMQTYGKVKSELLLFSGLKNAVLNMDDDWVASLVDMVPASVNIIRCSIEKEADVYLQNIQLTDQGATADIITPWGKGVLHSPLMGKFNLNNLLLVIAAVCAQGYSLAQVLSQVKELLPAPGRMQGIVVDAHQDINVVVDYAHTPDALETTLKALRQHKHDRIWTVFGCGGDRDKTKRPQMGRIAETYSDCVLVTNDNPRSEDPALIAADIVRGMKNPRACLTIADRAQAIDMAVQQARSGDLVLIAGKGHENYQIFAQQTIAFSDEQQARLALQRRLVKQSNNFASGASL